MSSEIAWAQWMWSALPDAHVRLALAPDVRLVRASDCTSGWHVLSDARVCTAEMDHSERDVEPFRSLLVGLILKYGDRLSYVANGGFVRVFRNP